MDEARVSLKTIMDAGGIIHNRAEIDGEIVNFDYSLHNEDLWVVDGKFYLAFITRGGNIRYIRHDVAISRLAVKTMQKAGEIVQ